MSEIKIRKKLMMAHFTLFLVRYFLKGKRWDVGQCFVRQLFGFSWTMQE
jgi:hypothetical protein